MRLVSRNVVKSLRVNPAGVVDQILVGIEDFGGKFRRVVLFDEGEDLGADGFRGGHVYLTFLMLFFFILTDLRNTKLMHVFCLGA